MGTSVETIQLKMAYDGKDADQGVYNLSKAFKELETGAGRFTANLAANLASGAIKMGLDALKSGLAAVKNEFTGIIDSAAQFEVSQKRLEASLRLAGSSWDQQSVAVKKLQEEMWKLAGLTRTDVNESMQKIMSFGADIPKSMEAVRAAMLISKSGIMDFGSATEAIAASLNGMTRGLSRFVVGMKELTPEELKAGKGIELILEQFKEFEKVSTYAGSVKRLSNAFEELRVTLGSEIIKNLSPLFKDLAEQIRSFAESDKAKQVAKDLGTIAENFVKIGISLLGGGTGKGLADCITDLIHRFAEWTSTKDFEATLVTWGKRIGELADSVGKLIQNLLWITNIIRAPFNLATQSQAFGTAPFGESTGAGGGFGFAEGGRVRRGSGIRDDVVAFLKKDEYVLPPEMAQDIGYELLDAWRALYGYTGRGGPGYQEGGTVSNTDWLNRLIASMNKGATGYGWAVSTLMGGASNLPGLYATFKQYEVGSGNPWAMFNVDQGIVSSVLNAISSRISQSEQTTAMNTMMAEKAAAVGQRFSSGAYLADTGRGLPSWAQLKMLRAQMMGEVEDEGYMGTTARMERGGRPERDIDWSVSYEERMARAGYDPVAAYNQSLDAYYSNWYKNAAYGSGELEGRKGIGYQKIPHGAFEYGVEGGAFSRYLNPDGTWNITGRPSGWGIMPEGPVYGPIDASDKTLAELMKNPNFVNLPVTTAGPRNFMERWQQAGSEMYSKEGFWGKALYGWAYGLTHAIPGMAYNAWNYMTTPVDTSMSSDLTTLNPWFSPLSSRLYMSREQQMNMMQMQGLYDAIYGGRYHSGGIVQGDYPGQETWIRAHAGEQVVPAGMGSGMIAMGGGKFAHSGETSHAGRFGGGMIPGADSRYGSGVKCERCGATVFHPETGICQACGGSYRKNNQMISATTGKSLAQSGGDGSVLVFRISGGTSENIVTRLFEASKLAGIDIEQIAEDVEVLKRE